jgi:fructokinase
MSFQSLGAKIMSAPQKGRRKMVALAGAPASGKSTLAEEIVQYLRGEGHSAQVVPMDGFHLDNAILEPRGDLAVKGAHQTFDAEGFVHLVKRVQTEDQVYFPTFDRGLDKAVAGSGLIDRDCEIAVFEGNYLLFDVPVWRDLKPIWDISIRLDVPFDVLERRLVQRWLDHGLTQEAAMARALGNDIPNAQSVIDFALAADIVV